MFALQSAPAAAVELPGVRLAPLSVETATSKFDLSLETVGYVSMAYGGAASLSQPLFGLLADRKGTRLVGLALFWTAATFSMIGFVPSFTTLIILAALDRKSVV